MSFPRAKLQRFNESTNATPSPADYNVNLKNKVTGAVIPKCGRFQELRSSSQSDNGSVASNTSIPNNTSVFRTPNPPRRKLQHSSSVDHKLKPTELFHTVDDIEALKEKIVECNNKDAFIQELTEQIEEMKLQLSDLEKQLCNLKGDKQGLEETVELLETKHEDTISNLNIAHQEELGKLNEKVFEISNKMNLMKQEYAKLKEANKQDLANVLNNINKLEELNDTLTQSYNNLLEKKMAEVEIKEKVLDQLERDFEMFKQNHQQAVTSLKKQHSVEIQDIEFEMLKTVTNMQKQIEMEKHSREKIEKQKEIELRQLQLQFEGEKLLLQNDTDAKIKQIVENYKEANLLAEMQMKEKYSDIEMTWKIKLNETKAEHEAILKECQEITEYNIIQCEVEKNKALYELTEKTRELETATKENSTTKNNYNQLETVYKKLEIELANTIKEVDVLRKQLAAKIEEHETFTTKLLKERQIYEVTIIKTHKTVETLKKRLMRSDQDVEQLKAELEATEESKLEIEGKCNQLTDELEIICGLCDDLEEQNELALKVAEEKVVNLERQLLNKVDHYKEKAEGDIKTLSNELSIAKEELKKAFGHLHEQQRLNIQAQTLVEKSKNEIEGLEQVNSEYAIKIDHLEAAFNNLQTEFKNKQAKEESITKSNECLKDENSKLKNVIDLMQTTESALLQQVEDLSGKCKSYKEDSAEQQRIADESLLLQYHDLSIKYDDLMERVQLMETENRELRQKVADQESLIGPFRDSLQQYEMEFNALKNEKLDIEQEAKEMGLKYAAILGHQNQKQKIKHLIDLKKKNYDLSENKKDLENKVRSQLRTIEKLKKELSTLTKSPSKMRPKKEDKENVESPGGPLRDRNNISFQI